MRVEACDRDARVLVTGRLQALPRQFDFRQDTIDRQTGGNFGQRNMRGDARIPDFFQNVELTHLAGKADDIGDETDFVVIARIGKNALPSC